MSGLGPIVEDFGGEPRTFRVLVPQLEQIQTRTGVGPGDLAHRLAIAVETIQANPKAGIFELVRAGLGPLHPEDVRAPIFCGLIGGGLAPNDAGRLVRDWIDGRGFDGLVENVTLALQLVVAGYAAPVEDDDPGEPAAGAPTTSSPAAG